MGLTAGAAALALLGYAAGIEPYLIEIIHIDIRMPRLPAAFEGYSICQISDLHMRQVGRRERKLRRLLQDLPTPDLVAVTGDMVHTPAGIGPFLELARSFHAHDGTYAVFGNSEHKNGVRPHALSVTLVKNGVIPLMNAHVLLERSGERLALAGVDDPVNDRDRIAEAISGISPDVPTVLLMHSPDSVAEAVLRGIDVVLSGHTHGGQVSIPLLGAPYTHSVFGRRMSHGYYGGKKLRRIIGIRPGRTQLYVTRGLGVSGLALRFLAPPELTLITLRRGTPGINRHARPR
jgi:hypothetical protein